MFKYTPCPKLVKRFTMKEGYRPSFYATVVTTLRKYMDFGASEDLNLYTIAVRDFVNAKAFYSEKKVRHILIRGHQFPVSMFVEEEIQQ